MSWAGVETERCLIKVGDFGARGESGWKGLGGSERSEALKGVAVMVRGRGIVAEVPVGREVCGRRAYRDRMPTFLGRILPVVDVCVAFGDGVNMQVSANPKSVLVIVMEDREILLVTTARYVEDLQKIIWLWLVW